MTIYQIVQFYDREIVNIVASYTNLAEAEKELIWRQRTAQPTIRDYRMPMRDFSYDQARESRTLELDYRIEFRIIDTILITDKFTEFTLKGTQ